MDLHDICKSLAADPIAAAELSALLPEAVPEQWRDLAVALQQWSRQRDSAIGDRQQNQMESEDTRLRDRAGRVLGICGGQGAGKSSLAAGIVAAAERIGQRAVSLSLDDFYLTKNQRTDLARQVHPLLVTRGVPGTHDVALCIRTIEDLLVPGHHQIPRFDKGQDDRQSRDKWDAVAGPFDLVVLEGWCVGAPPQPRDALSAPCNELESSTDSQGVWRGYVNDCLRGDYQALWRLVDELIFLAVPDMDAVLRWRGHQELERPPELRMASAQIAEFVAHYERLTRWMQAEMPAIAHLTGTLDESHNLVELTQRR